MLVGQISGCSEWIWFAATVPPDANCPISAPSPPVWGIFLRYPEIPSCAEYRVGLQESDKPGRPKESWPRKFEQVDKWSFCLIAPTMAANRRPHRPIRRYPPAG